MSIDNGVYKKALMVQYPCARGRAFVCKNIGDYIQSVATRQFLSGEYEYIEQEEADQYFPDDKVPAKMIMNGWFQWRAENWPPSEYINPLLISMHISPIKADELLTEEGIAFLKKNEPIGCRDYYTKELLESVGIKAYFSGCMTLTLGRSFKSEEKKGVCFVDPYFEIPKIVVEKEGKKSINYKQLFSSIGYFLKHPFIVYKLAKKNFFEEYSPTGFLDRNRNKFRTYYKAILFLKQYSLKFDKKLLLHADYVTHWLDVDMSKDTNDDLLNLAEKLIKKYASSKLVVTSRIHAGLPCLGVDTTVIFVANEEVTSENGNFNTPGRLGGLLELFRVVTITNNKFETNDEVLKKIDKVNEKTCFENKKDWEKLAIDLSEKCIRFME